MQKKRSRVSGEGWENQSAEFSGLGPQLVDGKNLARMRGQKKRKRGGSDKK